MTGSTNAHASTVYYLGTGTSFDIKSIFPELYSRLTADDFIIGGQSLSAIGGGACPYRDDTSMHTWGGGTISKTYNNITGILTINTVEAGASINNGGPKATISMSYFAYFVTGSIRSI